MKLPHIDLARLAALSHFRPESSSPSSLSCSSSLCVSFLSIQFTYESVIPVNQTDRVTSRKFIDKINSKRTPDGHGLALIVYYDIAVVKAIFKRRAGQASEWLADICDKINRTCPLYDDIIHSKHNYFINIFNEYQRRLLGNAANMYTHTST